MKYISYSLFLISLLAAQTSYSSESSDGYTSDKELNKIFLPTPKTEQPSTTQYFLSVRRKPKTTLPETRPLFGDIKPFNAGKKR